MGLIGAVPLWAWALAASLLWGGWQHHRAERAGKALLEHQTKTATLRESAMHSALVETTRRLAAQQESADAAETAARAARLDADAAGDAAGRLRAHVARLAASAGTCHPAAAASGPAASAPGLVLADMFRRVEAAGREHAAESDRRSIAGADCQRRYDALTP